MNNNTEILDKLKENVKKVPVAYRGKALAIYNLLKKYFDAESKVEDEMEVHNKEYEKNQWTSTSAMDEIIDGQRKVNEDEIKSVTDYLKEDEKVEDEANDGKRMDGYWLKCFKNASVPMKEADEEILKSLKQIDIKSELKSKEPKQPKVLTLKMFFEPNEHFENEELTCVVDYEYSEQVKKSTGCEINWKQGKRITTKPDTKKKSQKERKMAKQGKTIPKEDKLSLFDIFARDYTFEEATKMEPTTMQPSLFYVEEMVDIIGEVCGEDSLLYYLEVEKGGFDLDDDMEIIDEDEEDDDEDEEPNTASAKKHRKISTKSNKSKKSKKSRKNTEEDVKIPTEPNKEECKNN